MNNIDQINQYRNLFDVMLDAAYSVVAYRHIGSFIFIFFGMLASGLIIIYYIVHKCFVYLFTKCKLKRCSLNERVIFFFLSLFEKAKGHVWVHAGV